MLCGAAVVLGPLEAKASRYMLVSGPCYACVRMNVLMLVLLNVRLLPPIRTAVLPLLDIARGNRPNSGQMRRDFRKHMEIAWNMLRGKAKIIHSVVFC